MGTSSIKIDGPLMSLELNREKNKVAVAGRRGNLIVFNCKRLMYLEFLK